MRLRPAVGSLSGDCNMRCQTDGAAACMRAEQPPSQESHLVASNRLYESRGIALT